MSFKCERLLNANTSAIDVVQHAAFLQGRLTRHVNNSLDQSTNISNVYEKEHFFFLLTRPNALTGVARIHPADEGQISHSLDPLLGQRAPRGVS